MRTKKSPSGFHDAELTGRWATAILTRPGPLAAKLSAGELRPLPHDSLAWPRPVVNLATLTSPVPGGAATIAVVPTQNHERKPHEKRFLWKDIYGSPIDGLFI
jgi:hypothetical protein